MGYLSRAFTMARRMEKFPRQNPVADVPKREVVKPLPDYLRPEVPPLLALLKPKWKSLFATALYTGSSTRSASGRGTWRNSLQVARGRTGRDGGARRHGTVRLTATHWLAPRFIIPALPDLQTRYPDNEMQLVDTNQILNPA